MSIDEIIINKLYNKIWDENSDFFLPRVLTKGLKKGDISIDPIQGKDLGELEPISLFEHDKSGKIYIILSSNKLFFEEIHKGSFNYDDVNKVITIDMNIDSLVYGGNYTVGVGIDKSCAVGTAADLLKTFGTRAYVASFNANEVEYPKDSIRANVADAANTQGYNPDYDKPLNKPDAISTANTYRSKLDNTDAGSELNKIYAKNNEIINKILNSNSQFAHAWKNHKTPARNDHSKNKDTKYFANQTHDAAKNPNDHSKVIGDYDYQQHAYVLQYSLQKNAQAMQKTAKANKDQDTDNKCQELLNDLKSFYQHAQDPKYKNPNTVEQVMQSIKDRPVVYPLSMYSNTVLKDTTDPLVKQAHTIAEQEIQKWLSVHNDLIIGQPHDRFFSSMVLSDENTENTDLLNGEFSDQIHGVKGSLGANIAVSNDSSTITFTVNDISLNISELNIILRKGGNRTDDLFVKVQEYISNNSAVKTLIKQHINEGIQTSKTKQNISDFLNKIMSEIQNI